LKDQGTSPFSLKLKIAKIKDREASQKNKWMVFTNLFLKESRSLLVITKQEKVKKDIFNSSMLIKFKKSDQFVVQLYIN